MTDSIIVEKKCDNCKHYDGECSICLIDDSNKHPEDCCENFRGLFCYNCYHFNDVDTCNRHEIILEPDDYCEDFCDKKEYTPEMEAED